MYKEKHVRYNCRKSESNPERLEWWFLIINQNREIEEIQQRIYNFLAMIEEEKSFGGVVKGTGLRYKLINFESKKKAEWNQLSKIYKKVIKDTDLYDREKQDGLENFLINQFES